MTLKLRPLARTLWPGGYWLAGLMLSAVAPLPGVAATLVPQGSGPSWSSVAAPAIGQPSTWQGVSVQGPAPPVRLVPVATNEPATSAASTAVGQATPGPGQQAQEELLPADADAVAAAPIERPYLLSPSLGGGVPTGYVGGWGDYSIAGSLGTPGNLRDGVVDASINLSFGLGDPVRAIGMDVNWGIGSIKNFNANGSVGASIGRILVNRPDLQVAVAGGLLDAYAYGTEAGQPSVNGYGAVTVSLPLRPGDPRFPQRLQLTLGGGGNSFGAIDANFQSTDAGFFAAAGVELSPNLGISVGQSSRSTNINLSYIPFTNLPVFVNLLAADVFASTPFGTTGVLSVGWGDSLQRGLFSD